MTREERLYSMRMIELVAEAEKIGVKIDKKGSKEKAVNKILAFEVKKAETINAEDFEESTVIETKIETQEPAEQEPVKRTRKRKELSGNVIALLGFITNNWERLGGIIKLPKKENALFRPLCNKNGRQVIKLMWTTTKVSMFVRVAPATDYAEKWQKITYSMPYQCMFFSYNDETRVNIINLLEMMIESDNERFTRKTK